MTAFLLAALLWAAAEVPFNGMALPKLLKGVEDRYNRAKSLQIQFEQSQSGRGRITRIERGQLYMQKPGKMRWDYNSPAGKVFLSDGKYLYYYSPDAGQVQRSKVSSSEDMRAPLGFLMGNLDFYRDFREFRTSVEADGVYLVAQPKSDNAPYREVAFLVRPDFRVDQLRITAKDGSTIVYKLHDERVDPPISSALFQFKMPPGAQLIDEDAQR
ncbi:MAG: outer membrane lipoprotein chaperone LolA [Bryobacteraceae bacterium]